MNANVYLLTSEPCEQSITEIYGIFTTLEDALDARNRTIDSCCIYELELGNYEYFGKSLVDQCDKEVKLKAVKYQVEYFGDKTTLYARFTKEELLCFYAKEGLVYDSYYDTIFGRVNQNSVAKYIGRPCQWEKA